MSKSIRPVSFIWGFIVYPITCLGVCNYALKMFKGETVRLDDIFKFYKVRLKEALYISFLMNVIGNLVVIKDISIYFNIISDSLIFDTIGLVFLMFMVIRLVLLPFIFVENIETSVISMITRAWELSKGRCVEIISIFLKIFLAIFLFIVMFSIIVFAFSFSLPIIGVGISFMGLLLLGFVSIYQNLVFAEFSLEVFKEEGLLK